MLWMGQKTMCSTLKRDNDKDNEFETDNKGESDADGK